MKIFCNFKIKMIVIKKNPIIILRKKRTITFYWIQTLPTPQFRANLIFFSNQDSVHVCMTSTSLPLHSLTLPIAQLGAIYILFSIINFYRVLCSFFAVFLRWAHTLTFGGEKKEVMLLFSFLWNNWEIFLTQM